MPVPKPTKDDYLAAIAQHYASIGEEMPDYIGSTKEEIKSDAVEVFELKVAYGDADRIAAENHADLVKNARAKADSKPLVETKHDTREAWLRAAYAALTESFGWAFNAEEGFDHKPFDIQIATGFPRQDRNGKVRGQCWDSESGLGTRNIFISPLLVDPADVLGVLLHEMIHAHDNCNDGHKGAFRRVNSAVGFIGKPTSSEVKSIELLDTFKTISGDLGWYPHTRMDPANKAKVQTTRMLKVECPQCGCIARMTQKWLDESGAPTCGCGERMEEE